MCGMKTRCANLDRAVVAELICTHHGRHALNMRGNNGRLEYRCDNPDSGAPIELRYTHHNEEASKEDVFSMT